MLSKALWQDDICDQASSRLLSKVYVAHFKLSNSFDSPSALMIDLRGKRAIVTGGSRGIGAATAILLARAGANVGIGYRSREDEAAATVSTIELAGSAAFAVRGDLATRNANEALIARAESMWGGVDIFVGNSGIWPPDPVNVAELDEDRWRRTFDVNVDGMFFGAQAALRARRPTRS